MESSTKTRLTNEQIDQLVKLNFDDTIEICHIESLTAGMMNAAWTITFKTPINGTKAVILKVSFTPDTKTLTYEKGLMWAEIEFYKHLEKKDIPIPKLLAYDFSKKYINCDYFFMTKLAGQPWYDLDQEEKITEQNKEALKKELGRYNAMIHSCQGNYFGYIREHQEWHHQSWDGAFIFMLQNIIQDGKKEHIDLYYDEIMAAVEKHRNLLSEITEPMLINYDMWAGNVLLEKKQEQYVISGIIDFERCFYGDPFADFIASFNIYSDIEIEKGFQQEYQRYLQKPFIITENDRKRMELYKIYMALILAIETYRFDEDYALETISASKNQILDCLQHL